MATAKKTKAKVPAQALATKMIKSAASATALELARKKLELMRNDFDKWESTTLSADFPPSRG